MNILFSGGGTAGHVNPALAIAEAFISKYPKAKIAFIGREGGKENELVYKEGFKVFTIAIEGLSRNLSIQNIRKVKDAFKAKKKAQDILSDFKPDIVVGTGGYVCWPVISAAKKLGIKTAIHESNASFGLTTRLLADKCDLLLLGTKTEKCKYKNAIFTGNPLRKKFKSLPSVEAKKIMGIPPNKKLILSVGGSIGAKKLNEVCLSLMNTYSIPNDNIYHLHSIGYRYFEELKESSPNICHGTKGCKAVPFINDMSTALCAADVVISRCGAMTLSEIAFCGAASILIPSPNVTGNHQMKNALYFKEQGAAKIIEEKNLSENILNESIKELLENDSLREKMKKCAKKLSVPDSTEKILKVIENELLTK